MHCRVIFHRVCFLFANSTVACEPCKLERCAFLVCCDHALCRAVRARFSLPDDLEQRYRRTISEQFRVLSDCCNGWETFVTPATNWSCWSKSRLPSLLASLKLRRPTTHKHEDNDYSTTFLFCCSTIFVPSNTATAHSVQLQNSFHDEAAPKHFLPMYTFIFVLGVHGHHSRTKLSATDTCAQSCSTREGRLEHRCITRFPAPSFRSCCPATRERAPEPKLQVDVASGTSNCC